jgi:hypothetical protein
MGSLPSEIKRRKVIRVAGIYVLADEGMLPTPQEVLQLEDFSFDPFLFE